MKIEGKVAVVTGGAQGMGRACVEALVQQGAKVCVGDVLAEKGSALVEELNTKHDRTCVIFQHCDVTNEEHIQNLFQLAKDQFEGPVEIVLNSVGIIHEFEWQKCIDVNLGGVIRICNVAFQHMGKDNGGEGGVVTHIASVTGYCPLPPSPVYAASKHAIVGYVRSVGSSFHLEKHGIRFNCICPSGVATPFLKEQMTAEKVDRLAYRDFTALSSKGKHREPGYYLMPEQIAEGLLQLVDNDTYNGEIMQITKSLGIEIITLPGFPPQ